MNINLKPYRTAHEKLIEMGYEFIKGNNCVFYRHDELPRVTIYSDNTYSCSDTNLELSRILTQYLEEIEMSKSIYEEAIKVITYLQEQDLHLIDTTGTIYSPSEEELAKVRQKIQEIKEIENDKEEFE